MDSIEIDKLEKKIVWLFGTPRSGSTWLAMEILKKKRILTHDEPMIGAHLGAFRLDPTILFNILQGHTKIHFHRLVDVDRNGIFFSKFYKDAWQKPLKDLILNRLIAQHGKNTFDYLVVKSPNESHGADIIMQCFNKSKLIFLIRDGRDVIDSRLGKKFLSNRDTITPENKKFRVIYYSLIWNMMIEKTNEAYESHPQDLRLLLKYEDIRLNPILEIGKIYKFLDYDLSRNEIEEIANRTKFENVSPELKGDNQLKRKAKPGSYKDYFSVPEIKIMNSLMGDNLLKFGYKI